MPTERTPGSIHRSAALALLCLCTLGTAPAVGGQVEPGRLQLDPVRQTVEPGETADLTVRLLDREGRPVATRTPLTVALHDDGKLLTVDRLVIAPGEGSGTVTLSAPAPGGWTVRALAPGWQSASARILAIAPAKTAAVALAERPAAVASVAEPPGQLEERADVRTMRIPAGVTIQDRPAAAPRRPTRGAAEPPIRVLEEDSPRHRPSAPPPARPTEAEITVPTNLTSEQVREVVEGLADPGFEAAGRDRTRVPGMADLRSDLLAALASSTGGEPIRLAGSAGSPRLYNLVGLPGISGVARVLTGTGADPTEGTTLVYGEIRLFAEPERPIRPAGGRWDPVTLIAEWWEGDADDLRPTRRADDLSVRMRLDSQADLEPRPLVVPAGKAVATARLSSRRAQTVKVWASWEGASAHRELEIRFLPPGAERLQLADVPESVQGLGPIRRLVRIRLVDDTGRRVRAESPLEVRLYWRSDLADGSEAGTIAEGADWVDLPIALPDAGTYRIVAEAVGVSEAEATLRYSMAWWLLLVAAASGVVGAVVAQLVRKTMHWLRAIVLGLVAGALVTLLFLFGLLGYLAGVIPLAGALQESVPKTLLGILLVSFVAGLAFEALFTFFRGRSTLGGAAADGG